MNAMKQPTWKRYRLSIALVAIVAIYLLHVVPGQRAVAALCKRDGGISIYATTSVSGFYDLTAPNECSSCVDWLTSGAFEWVGFQGDPRRYGVKGAPGFYRMSFQPSGNDGCSTSQTAIAAEYYSYKRDGRPGLPEGMCIALTPTGSAPDGMVLELQRTKIDYRLFNSVVLVKVRIRDPRTGGTLGQFRNYYYTSTIAEVADLGSHIGEPDAQCPAPVGGWFNIEVFVRKVLRDESKRPNPSPSQ